MDSSQTLADSQHNTLEVQVAVPAATPAGRGYSNNTTYDDLTYIDQQIVDYQAMSGLLIDEAGTPKQISAQVFATMLGYKDRQSLYDRQKAIPNFWALARERRRVISEGRVVAGVWKGVIMQAMQGKPKQAEMVLTHFGDYTPPAQKVEHNFGGMSDLLQAFRASQQKAQQQTPAPPALEGPSGN